ncbi:MAG: TIGR00180 family glycosyltransferase [Alphaproteobacteria bacterium]|nr:TIGR00180 family glycosyltransferase [Alphaproteobacteria bacterium]
MARLLIPTRNRPASLGQVLDFLNHFYPDTQVIVADGSSEDYKNAVKAVTDSPRKISVDLRSYDYDFPFFDRILDVIENEPDEFFVMGSDDDFPLMEVMGEAEEFLRKNSAYSTALGALVHLKLDSPHEMTARLGVARPLVAAAPQRRASDFAAWPFSTTYAITRRDLLLERYRRAQKGFLAGFFDFAVGLQDCLAGKMHAIPDFGYICTRNFNHSYLRAGSELIFLRRSELALQVVDQIRDDLIAMGGVGEDEAMRLAENLMKRRIAELCGSPAHRMRDFHKSRFYRDKTVQKQFEQFNDVFKKGTETRNRYEERLMFISNAIRGNSVSEDNKGENRFYETLAQQASG